MDSIERIIRDKMYDHASTVPDHIWSNIEKELPRERRKVLPFFLIGALGCFLVVILLFPMEPGVTHPNKGAIAQHVQTAESTVSSKYSPTISSVTTENQLTQSSTKKHINVTQKSELAHKNESYTFISRDIENIQNVNLIFSSNSNEQRDSHREKEKDDLINKKSHNNLEEIKAHNTFIQSIQPLSIHALPTIQPAIKEPLFCPKSKRDARVTRSIEIYAGLDYPLRFLSASTSEPQQNYIDRRNNSENAIVSFHGGVRLVQPISKSIAIKIGAEYAKINERFELIDSGAVRVQTVIDSIFAPDGTLIDIQSRTLTENGIRAVNHYNKIRWMTIPISMGYYHNWKSSTLYAHLGAQFTIGSSYSGKILSPLFSAVTIGSGDPAKFQPYTDNFGINVIGSIGIINPLTERWSYFVEPNFRYTLNSITRSSYPLDQKYLTLGISAGLNYTF